MTYQVFEDAHYVDSALCGGTPESWESTRENAVVDTVKITYISQNGAIWGVPLDYSDYTTLTLDADDAVDVGGGTVGLPCAGHPFKIGDVIWIEGSTNYEDAHTLTSGTTANELQFEDTFNAETFAGTETIVQYIALSTSYGRMDMDGDGNLYFGRNITLTDATGIVKISIDGTIDDDFFSPVGGWPNASDREVGGVKVSTDNEYLYVHIGDARKTYKFSLTDGSEIWSVSNIGSGVGYNIDTDSSDNVYVCGAGTGITDTNCVKFAAADGTPTELTDTGLAFDVHVDNDMSYTAGKTGVVIVGGWQFGSGDTGWYNLAIRDLDNTDGAQIALGGIYLVAGNVYSTRVIGSDNITTYNNFIYVLCQNTDGDLVVHKLDSDLATITTIATGDMPSYPAGLFVDTEGHIVVINQNNIYRQQDIFWFYDTDFNYLGKTDGLEHIMLSAWAGVGGAISQGNVKYFYNVAPHGINTTYVTQKRNLWFPSDYCHLKGETVKKFVDGEILDDEVVPESCEVVGGDGDAVHIGLAFTYKLKPMRLVFSARKGTNLGSIKHLNEMVVNFLDTLNAKYGKDTDSLYDIMWASASEFFSGDYTVALDSGFGKDDDVLISGDDPVPCTVRAMIPRVDVTGR